MMLKTTKMTQYCSIKELTNQLKRQCGLNPHDICMYLFSSRQIIDPTNIISPGDIILIIYKSHMDDMNNIFTTIRMYYNYITDHELENILIIYVHLVSFLKRQQNNFDITCNNVENADVLITPSNWRTNIGILIQDWWNDTNIYRNNIIEIYLKTYQHLFCFELAINKKQQYTVNICSICSQFMGVPNECECERLSTLI